ncbi:ComF family protein [Corticicoccus populi]|uniref:ComF family protein n=1 Tax=Corticicoccus populi TaxID=1812821 RepID=A0ABW5WY12_9STAP
MITLFQKVKPLCISCEVSLGEWRPGERCARCYHLKKPGMTDCPDCQALAIYPPLRKITCMLDYNEEVKMLFHRYKFVGDAALAEVLAMFLKYNFREYDVIIPVPVSAGRLRERGFNQTAMVLDVLKIKYQDILVTEKTERQSELKKTERLKRINPFRFKEGFDADSIQGSKVLIVDDIYTTGITVHQAAVSLYTGNPSVIDVLTFSKA